MWLAGDPFWVASPYFVPVGYFLTLNFSLTVKKNKKGIQVHSELR